MIQITLSYVKKRWRLPHARLTLAMLLHHFTRQVWDRIKIEQKINSVWEGNSLTTCYEYWAKIVRNFLTVPSLVCWFVWLERNKIVFENGNPFVGMVICKALRIVATSTTTIKVVIPKKFKIHLLGGTPAG